MISVWNYLLVIGATLYIAFMYHSPAVMLLCFMEAAFFVVAFLSLSIRCFRIRGHVDVPVGIAEKGKGSLVKLVINNRCFFSVNRARALITVYDTMRANKKRYRMTLPMLPRGESEYIQEVSFSAAGSYEICLRKLQIYDITGLLSCKVRTKNLRMVQVLPELHDVPVRLTPTVKNFCGEADVYDENLPGHDNSELFQVREYRAGDRLQNVHWKLTAKQDEFIVKEHSLPKACPVILFLSYRPGKKKHLPKFLEAVASLSFSIMDAGCPHYVVWYDATEQDVLRVRVDDEESLFYMLGILMKIRWCRSKEDITLRYQDKYRQEPYLWALTIDEKLQLYKGKELLFCYSAGKLKTSLGQTELVL